MGAGEVDGNVVFATEVEELFDPAEASGSGSTDAEFRVDGLHRAGGGFVELEVVGLSSAPEVVEVWFVPDFEIPLLDFLGTKALDLVLDELGDQLCPFGLRFWRGSVASVVEAGLFATRQGLRHVSELDEWADSDFFQAINEAVDLGPVKAERVVGVALDDVHLFVEYAVAAQVLELHLLLESLEVALVNIAQEDCCAVGADADERHFAGLGRLRAEVDGNLGEGERTKKWCG